MTDVTVVIPCYNGELYLAATIDSVLAQTYQDWELIVVDDGSTDRSYEVATSYQDDRIRVVRQSNSGCASARNRGLAMADPESTKVVFLDADDVWLPHTLAVLVERLQGVPASPAVFGREALIDGDGNRDLTNEPHSPRGLVTLTGRRVRRRTGATEAFAWDVLAVTPITTPGQCLIRRELLGPDRFAFDGSLWPCDDWDLWLQIAEVGPLAFVDELVLLYRRHATNASNDGSDMRRSRLAVYEKHRAVLRTKDPTAFDRAFAYGMFGNDIQLCQRWMTESWRSNQPSWAVRYGLRGLRSMAQYHWLRTTLWARRILNRDHRPRNHSRTHDGSQ